MKVCGCRPHEGGAAETAGPAYANLQGRKPREVRGGRASDAMGISASAVCRRCPLNASGGSDQGYDEPGWLGFDRQNRRRQREIERHDGYRGRREVEPDHCRSRVGEAET